MMVEYTSSVSYTIPLQLLQRIRKIIKLSQSINQYAVSPPVSSKTGNNKVVIGSYRVAMSLSHPYQLKMMTEFVLHNFIQPKEKLILADDLEGNYIEIIPVVAKSTRTKCESSEMA
jgi:hypothetical protein